MKKIFNIAAATALLFGTPAAAQETGEAYNFAGVKGGAQVTLTHFGFGDLITPQYGIYFGRYFNQFVGARLDVTGYQNKGGFKADRYDFITSDKEYKFNAVTADLDLLMNMTNIISPKRVNRTWDWNLLAGFGVNYTWKHGRFNDIVNAFDNSRYDGPISCSSKHATFNGRLGTQVECNVTDRFSIMLEADANYKNDQYNLKFNDQPDWQIQAFIGFTYKFGRKKAPALKKAIAPAPYVKEEPTPVVREEPKPAVTEEKPAPAAVVKEEPIKETFHYVIRQSDPKPEATLDKIAEWCRKYPDKTITVKGYADKGTGNARVNAMYAKTRAEKVAKALQDRGVSAGRMTVSSYGDTVQPFGDNDSNRCTIVEGR